MDSEFVTRFVMDRPFVPFEVFLSDGRVLKVPHSDFVVLERYAAAIIVTEPTGHSQLIDAGSIVSFRTLNPIESL
jgi:hypothetical protein